ncbi:MAG: ABC transporter permease [Gammaproteobacteria bacterium]|nr:ABC transporter permease [Gammaproteobacteria bacterium]
MRLFIEQTGRRFLDFTTNIGRLGLFLTAILSSIVHPPYEWRPIIRQIYFIGSRSSFVIIVTGLFTGMVLGLQGHHNLAKFGSEELLGSAVALSLIQELGPVLTALMVIGRAGSAICAEIGIMRHSEQIDALECMAIDPYKYLIAPKFIAAIISLPLLTFIFDILGIWGGYFVGVILEGVSEGAFFQGMYDSVMMSDILLGIYKSAFFGLLIALIATYKGFFLHLNKNVFGAEGVSQVTTDAVVMSSISVLIFDYIIGTLLL